MIFSLFIFDLVISRLMLEEKIGWGKGEVLIWLTGDWWSEEWGTNTCPDIKLMESLTE